jgi:hypothetical protein
MKKILLPVLMLLFLTSLSLSWEKGSVGLNMRVDPSPRIGMTYHISGKFALRPYVGFSIGNEETDAEFQPERNLPMISGTRKENSTNIHFGLGFLFYFYSAGDFSVYTGFNVGYTQVNREITFSWRDSEIKEDGDTYQVSAMLGLQGQVLKNVGIFGEVGFGYSIGKFNRRNDTENETSSQRWGLANTGVGIIFYF